MNIYTALEVCLILLSIMWWRVLVSGYIERWVLVGGYVEGWVVSV